MGNRSCNADHLYTHHVGLGAIEFTSIQFSTKLVGEFIILILAWSIQGTTEEILTRGWMFSSLSARHNIPIGIIVSSLFFTFLHLGNNAISLIPILDLTLFAVLACLIMLKTGNIWVIGGLHAAWNCFQGNVLLSQSAAPMLVRPLFKSVSLVLSGYLVESLA